MKKHIAVIVFLITAWAITACVSPTNNPSLEYSKAVGAIEEVSISPELLNKIECESFDIGTFTYKIINTPSPTSNLKYTTQTGNKFEVKYGDGVYYELSKDTSPFRVSCDSGNSMLPLFDCDDILLMKEVDSVSEVHLGDVILFRKLNDNLVIHRVFSISNGTYQTKGDNLVNAVSNGRGEIVSTDVPISFEQIKSKVVGVIYK